jgi:hypothetical protein
VTIEEEEHVPSRQFFLNQDRPDQLVVPTCSRCNRATAQSEQIVALLARAGREFTGVGLDDEWRLNQWVSQGLVRNHPEVLDEWLETSSRQRRTADRLQPVFGSPLEALNFGPESYRHVQAVGAKLGLALYYHEVGKILPLTGGATVKMWSDGDVLAGTQGPLTELLKIVGPIKTLAQGKKHVGQQFKWASKHCPVDGLFVLVIDLVGCCTLVAFVAEDASKISETLSDVYVHRPGNLTSYRNPKVIGRLRCCWTDGSYLLREQRSWPVPIRDDVI